ncbi:MAG: hypothetical protein FWG51_04375 [Firmicutes bacterium]|nr:hypothetical protein [Bacillota bacterium]
MKVKSFKKIIIAFFATLVLLFGVLAISSLMPESRLAAALSKSEIGRLVLSWIYW